MGIFHKLWKKKQQKNHKSLKEKILIQENKNHEFIKDFLTTSSENIKLIFLLCEVIAFAFLNFPRQESTVESFRVERKERKNWQNLNNLQIFLRQKLYFDLKAINFMSKHLKFIKVQPFFKATRSTLDVSGWNEYLKKIPLCVLVNSQYFWPFKATANQ